MVSDERIRYWVEQVNKDIGREDRNDASVRFFITGRDVGAFKFVDEEQYYIVYMVSPDMWGDLCLSVVSLFIKPEFRIGKYFLQIQRKINSLAKENKVVYTIQGSHIDDKYFKFLSGVGYRVSTMIKEY